MIPPPPPQPPPPPAYGPPHYGGWAPAPAPVRNKLRPSAAWYWVAGAIGVLGAIAASIMVVSSVVVTVNRVEDFQRVAVPGSGVITLDDTGGYTVYYEEPGIGVGFVPPLRVEIIEVATGDQLSLRPYDADADYTFGGHEGVAVFTFSIDRPGNYEVVAGGGHFAFEDVAFGEVAIGRSIFRRLFVGVSGGVVVGLVAVLATVLIAVITGVHRNDDRRRQQWGPTGRPPPSSYGPPPGYGAPPGYRPPPS